jgi:drug/metabolite transporter (DMT)-like permease
MKLLHALLVCASLSAAGGQMLLKAGAEGRQHWQEFVNWQVIAGLTGYGLSTLLWLYCLSKLPLRVVYPYTALTFVLVLLGAVMIFGERAGWRAGVGTALVFGGLLLIMADGS